MYYVSGYFKYEAKKEETKWKILFNGTCWNLMEEYKFLLSFYFGELNQYVDK